MASHPPLPAEPSPRTPRQSDDDEDRTPVLTPATSHQEIRRRQNDPYMVNVMQPDEPSCSAAMAHSDTFASPPMGRTDLFDGSNNNSLTTGQLLFVGSGTEYSRGPTPFGDSVAHPQTDPRLVARRARSTSGVDTPQNSSVFFHQLQGGSFHGHAASPQPNQQHLFSPSPPTYPTSSAVAGNSFGSVTPNHNSANHNTLPSPGSSAVPNEHTTPPSPQPSLRRAVPAAPSVRRLVTSPSSPVSYGTPVSVAQTHEHLSPSPQRPSSIMAASPTVGQATRRLSETEGAGRGGMFGLPRHGSYPELSSLAYNHRQQPSPVSQQQQQQQQQHNQLMHQRAFPHSPSPIAMLHHGGADPTTTNNTSAAGSHRPFSAVSIGSRDQTPQFYRPLALMHSNNVGPQQHSSGPRFSPMHDFQSSGNIMVGGNQSVQGYSRPSSPQTPLAKPSAHPNKKAQPSAERHQPKERSVPPGQVMGSGDAVLSKTPETDAKQLLKSQSSRRKQKAKTPQPDAPLVLPAKVIPPHTDAHAGVSTAAKQSAEAPLPKAPKGTVKKRQPQEPSDEKKSEARKLGVNDDDSDGENAPPKVTNDCFYFALSRVALPEQHIENLEARLESRRKQITLGCDTEGHRNFLSLVPKPERQVGNSRHPLTPRVNLKCSRRKFKMLVQQWRSELHYWDHVTDPSQTMQEGLLTLAQMGLEGDGSQDDHCAVVAPPLDIELVQAEILRRRGNKSEAVASSEGCQSQTITPAAGSRAASPDITAEIQQLDASEESSLAAGAQRKRATNSGAAVTVAITTPRSPIPRPEPKRSPPGPLEEVQGVEGN